MNKVRLIITSIISIILVSILLIGSTYSIFTTTEIDEKLNVYKTGDLNIKYSSNNVQITDTTPMTIEEADAVIPHRITVTNNGNVAYQFDVILSDTTSSETNTIDYQYIMTKVGYLEPKKLSSCTNNIIKEDVILLPGEVVDIDVRVWLSDNLSNSEIGKSFYAKLQIDGQAITNDNTEIDNSILSLRYMKNAGGSFKFNDIEYKTYIKEASFVDYIDITNVSIDTATNEKMIWDMSKNQDNSVVAWLEDNGTTDDSGNKYYNLYIGSKNKIYITGMGSLFQYMSKLENINFNNLSTSLNSSLQNTFQGCNSLISLDLSNFNTNNLTNIIWTFYGCSNLASLNLNNWNTSNVTAMNSAFRGCNKLTSLDLSNFDTSKVIEMGYIFSGCGSLTSLDVSNFDTSKVTNMGNMFDGCGNLTELDLSNFDTSKVTAMGCMFYNCKKLTELDLSNFDTSNVKSMFGTFYGCSSLTELDLNNFDTSNVTNMHDMFNGCSNLINLDLSNFDTSKVTTMVWMFYGCTNLVELDLSNFDTTKVTEMGNMFFNCKKLITTLTIRNESNTNYSGMFSGAATAEGAQITVNYTNDTSTLVDSMIATKSSNSNVVKGVLVA